MKANAPEKVYFSVIENSTHYFIEGIPYEREYIEYIRTDAFIEKATSYIQQHWIWNTKMIEDFKKYIEE